MGVCKEAHNKYLNFKCYSKLREYFIKKRSYNLTDAVKNFDIEYNKKPAENAYKYTEIFEELKKYLSNHHVFIEYNSDIYCNFITYLLYKKIREIHYVYEDSILDIFINYVARYNAYDKNHACESKIKYIDHDLLNKMEALYSLYDLYDDFKIFENFMSNPYFCKNLDSVVFFYNNFPHKYYKDDEVLVEKLKNLKNLIQNNDKATNNSCTLKVSILKSPELDRVNVVTVPENQIPESKLTDTPSLHSASGTHNPPNSLSVSNSQIESGSHTAPVLVEPPTLNMEKDLTEPQIPLELPENTVNGQETGELGYTGRTRHLERSAFLKEEHLPESFGGLSYYSPKTNDGMHESANVVESTNGSKGFLQTIQTAVVDTLGSVEPAPVLGVSGGMGILFVLFKYTPVGSFFGGRRGRNHRIPGSFAGHFPAEFPAFQEDGGYIGYSPMNMPFQAE